MRQIALIAVLAIAATSPLLAQGQRSGDIAVLEAWTRATVASAPVAAGYLTLRNDGASPDRLVSARSPAARAVELHEMRMDENIMRMRPVEGGLLIPARATVRLEPGGVHFMLVSPTQALRRGERVQLTLNFERSGDVSVELQVEAPGARGPAHAGH